MKIFPMQYEFSQPGLKRKNKTEKTFPGPHFRYFLLLFTGAVFAGLMGLTSCEEDDDTTQDLGTVLENYAHENQTLRAIGPEDMHAYTGNNPFLSIDGEGFHPQTGTLLVPGRSLSKDAVHPGEMLAILPVPQDRGTLTITNHAGGGRWYRFSGEEFFPGSKWTPGDDGLDVPGDEWMPQDRDSMEVLMYTGKKPVSELFGGTDISANQIDLAEGESQAVDSDKSRIGVAVTLDQLYNIWVSPRNNLAEMFFEDPQDIAFPVHPDSSAWVQPADGFFTVKGQGVQVKGIRAPLDVAMISGENFFPSDAFTPGSVSVFTVPRNELFPGLVYSGYQPPESMSNPDLLFFGSDRFQEVPNPRFTLHSPGEEMNVSATMVLLPVSVLEIRTGLTLYLDPAVRSIGSTGGETYWPDQFYYPSDFAFRSEVFMPDSEFSFLRPGMPYSSEAIMGLGISVNVGLE